jgi:quinol monooxygenase YgiN
MPTDKRVALKTVLIEMRFLGAHEHDALRVLRSVTGITAAKSGCRACSVARDAADDELFRYREQWNSETAFLRHIRSDEFQRVLVAMDMCSEEPQVLVGNLSGTSGMDCLRELRGE